MQILDVVFFAATVVAICYCSHHFWKKEAIQHADRWATENGLKLIDADSSSFRMHATRPHIVISAKGPDGKLYRCDLVLRLAFPSALRNWRAVELVEKYEIER